MGKIIDISGQRFGRLVAIRRTEEQTSGGNYIWMCECDCGNVAYVSGSKLRRGETRSCGCLARELSRDRKYRHGEARSSGHPSTRLYGIWYSIKARCENPKNCNYRYYGMRGVRMCEEWRDDFAKFREWALSNGYADNLTIDRIDPDGDYCSNNCRWTTLGENIRAATDEHRSTRKELERGVRLLGYPDRRLAFTVIQTLNGHSDSTPEPPEILQALLSQIAEATPTNRRIALAAVRGMLTRSDAALTSKTDAK